MKKALKAFLDVGTLIICCWVAVEMVGWVSAPTDGFIRAATAVCLVAIGVRLTLVDLGETFGWKESEHGS